MDSTEKLVLITGASRGIGKAILEAFAKLPYRIIGTATSQSGAESISASLQALGAKGQGMVVNIADPASIDSLLKSIQSDYGDPDILINNAGITRDNLLLRMSDEEWEQVVTTNLTSAFHLIRGCLKGMMKSRWGRVISISSVVGVTGNAGQGNYAAAKAGLIGLSKSLAQELGTRQITFNVVAPGFIDTDMTKELPETVQSQLLNQIPLKRLGKPEDIAHAVTFLASDQAGYITGETLHVNGGMYMS